MTFLGYNKSMFQKRLFKRLVALLLVIAFFYFVDEKLYLSWNYWWFDKLMHFGGGFAVSMAFAILCSYFSLFTQNKAKAISLSLLSVLVVGVAWEFFEIYADITFLSDGASYIKDTIFDIVMDLFGGYIGILYSLKFIKTNER